VAHRDIEQRGDVAVRDAGPIILVEQGFQGWSDTAPMAPDSSTSMSKRTKLRAQATVERRGYIAHTPPRHVEVSSTTSSSYPPGNPRRGAPASPVRRRATTTQ
jgi:hypothetical protein